MTRPPQLSFTITNPDPSKYLGVDITQAAASPIGLERKGNDNSAMCSTLVYAGTSCTQSVIFSPTAAGHYTATFVISGLLQGDAAPTTQTVTVTGDAVATGKSGSPSSPPATTRHACPPPRVRTPVVSPFDHFTDAVAERRFLVGYQTVVRAALARKPGPAVTAGLARIDRDLTRMIAAQDANARRLAVHADGGTSATNVAINDACDKGLKALRDHLAEYLDEAKIKGVDRIHVEQLADNLLILDRLLDPRYAEEVKPEEKKKILNDAMVGLVSALGGADKGELTANGKALYDVLSGGLDQKKSGELLRSKIAELVGKGFGKNGGELAGKLILLYDVLNGDMDEAKRDEVLKQEMIGLFTRITGKSLLDIPQVQAVIFGYEIAAPFGKTIAAELRQIEMYSLYLVCTAAGASTNGPGTVTIKTPGGVFDTWQVTSYVDPDLHRVVWAVSRPATFWDGVLGKKTTYILDPRFPGLVIGSN